MTQDLKNPKIASTLFLITIIATMAGIFITIYFLFTDAALAYRIAAAVLVGIIGIISFIRHSVFYQSDQARMGWQQDHPEFQFEVGYANLAFGISALLAAVLNWGSLACGMMLLTYGIYLLCAFFLHVYHLRTRIEGKARARKSVLNTGFFVFFLFSFAFLALTNTQAIIV
ncbi:MAG: hypothetical protein JXA44_04600 [Methanospirillaceae archaeon]|nr:hypothetical protein [Methanospirillaceae archaeon]